MGPDCIVEDTKNTVVEDTMNTVVEWGESTVVQVVGNNFAQGVEKVVERTFALERTEGSLNLLDFGIPTD